MKSRISPDEPFPARLERLRDEDVEVLNSKVHREIEHEFSTDGEVDAETAARKDELADELDERDAGPRLSLVPPREDDDAERGSTSAGHDSATQAGDPGASAGLSARARGGSWADAQRG
ncbi:MULTISPECIES: hypothetical protein [unclassified Arthrobacter]|uniref:hypothetical protein n=1 Tax=unclassified Arthrobacter TaxID=235627 RepID=UPI0006FC757A|nr:hypothetical protein [Arthrobacter sp. Leaf234]KQO02953.1 hypothetical protein ASF21_00985 [Arthrobacter sp. Leaf234]